MYPVVLHKCMHNCFLHQQRSPVVAAMRAYINAAWHFYKQASPTLRRREGMAMIGMIGGAGKANAGLAICVLGWIVMAFAIRDPGIGLDIVHLGILLIGFCLL